MKFLFALLLILVMPALVAAELFSEPQIGGHLKTSSSYLDRLVAAPGEGLLSSTRLRLDLRSRLLGRYDVELSAEQQLLWTDPPGLVGLPRDSDNRLLAGQKSWQRDERWSSQLQLDRLNLQGETGALHWSIGRQAIGFGSISLYSPLDVIAPFAPDSIDVDIRPGVDALRVGRYFGMAGQVDALAVFGDGPQHNSYLLTFGENLERIDLLLLLGSLRDRPMVGVGLAGELGAVGLKGEFSWYRGQQVGQTGGDRKHDFAVAAVEGWYRFAGGLVLLAEYLYNGVGSNDPNQYLAVAQSAPLREGLSFLLGRHYLLVGPSFDLHPLVTCSGLLIHNLQDESSLLRPQLSVSLADNLQLDLFLAYTMGDKTRFDPQTGALQVHSEFGLVGNSGGILLRWYF